MSVDGTSTGLPPDRVEGLAPTRRDYFLAAVVAVLVGSVLIDVIVFLGPDLSFTLAYFVLTELILVIVSTGAAITFGLPLVVFAHRRLQHVPQIGTHVLVFAAIGAVTGGLTMVLLLPGGWSFQISAPIMAATAAAAAVGRLAIARRGRRFGGPAEVV